MENFIAYNPTRLHFGKNVTDMLGDVVKEYGKHVFLIYGQGSVKKYGYYDKVVKQLKNSGLKITEYGGIRPNPVLEDVEKAAALGKQKNIDILVALGGGSVIDSAKIIGLCIASDTRAWDFMKWRVQPKASIPLVNVLTLAATGTEMNGAAVIQNPETGEKLGFVDELNFPKHSFLDPMFTTSVPADYTAYGIVDLIAHALEAFFGKGESSITDRIIFSIIKDAFYWGPKLLQDLQNYNLRANIMLDATLALNGLTYYGTQGGDWGVHAIGHQLSYLYDTPHGATLSIAYPAWLKLQKNRIPDRIKALGKGLYNTDSVNETIELLTRSFTGFRSPVNLSDLNMGLKYKAEILEQLNKSRASGMHHQLNKDDHLKLVNFMM